MQKHEQSFTLRHGGGDVESVEHRLQTNPPLHAVHQTTLVPITDDGMPVPPGIDAKVVGGGVEEISHPSTPGTRCRALPVDPDKRRITTRKDKGLPPALLSQ